MYILHFNHDHTQSQILLAFSKVMFIRVDIDKFMSEIFSVVCATYEQ